MHRDVDIPTKIIAQDSAPGIAALRQLQDAVGAANRHDRHQRLVDTLDRAEVCCDVSDWDGAQRELLSAMPLAGHRILRYGIRVTLLKVATMRATRRGILATLNDWWLRRQERRATKLGELDIDSEPLGSLNIHS